MRIETIERKLYKFNELNDKAKQKAIEDHSRFIGENFDAEFIIEDAKTIAAIMGIEIKNIYYSGFWSQGDGACFTGSYAYKKGSVKAVKEYAPNDNELHNIVQGLHDIQKANGYDLTVTDLRHRGHYYHEGCIDLNVFKGELFADTSVESTVKELLQDLMRWIYRSLEREYEYQTGEAQVIESIKANDYEFTEDGRIA